MIYQRDPSLPQVLMIGAKEVHQPNQTGDELTLTLTLRVVNAPQNLDPDEHSFILVDPNGLLKDHSHGFGSILIRRFLTPHVHELLHRINSDQPEAR